jgi:hypothetical protein
MWIFWRKVSPCKVKKPFLILIHDAVAVRFFLREDEMTWNLTPEDKVVTSRN